MAKNRKYDRWQPTDIHAVMQKAKQRHQSNLIAFRLPSPHLYNQAQRARYIQLSAMYAHLTHINKLNGANKKAMESAYIINSGRHANSLGHKHTNSNFQKEFSVVHKNLNITSEDWNKILSNFKETHFSQLQPTSTTAKQKPRRQHGLLQRMICCLSSQPTTKIQDDDVQKEQFLNI